jgi:uncharacterized protein GlcG (DUF336 family)
MLAAANSAEATRHRWSVVIAIVDDGGKQVQHPTGPIEQA